MCVLCACVFVHTYIFSAKSHAQVPAQRHSVRSQAVTIRAESAGLAVRSCDNHVSSFLALTLILKTKNRVHIFSVSPWHIVGSWNISAPLK